MDRAHYKIFELRSQYGSVRGKNFQHKTYMSVRQAHEEKIAKYCFQYKMLLHHFIKNRYIILDHLVLESNETHHYKFSVTTPGLRNNGMRRMASKAKVHYEALKFQTIVMRGENFPSYIFFFFVQVWSSSKHQARRPLFEKR